MCSKKRYQELVLSAVLILFCANLQGREDPFSPILNPLDGKYPQNEKRIAPFVKEDINLPSTARIIKEIEIKYQNIDGTIDVKKVNLDKGIDWHFPLTLTQEGAIKEKKKESKTKKYKIADYDFYVRGKNLYIYSDTDIVRNFALSEPYRICIDFEKSESEIAKNSSLDVNQKYFRNVEIGTHRDFYRIIITLDGQYRYSLKKDRRGVLIDLE